MKVMGKQMTPWQACSHYLVQANERDCEVIGELEPLDSPLRELEIAKAHEFLSHNGISIKHHGHGHGHNGNGNNHASTRPIDNFDIRSLRVNFEQSDQMKVSTNYEEGVRAFPADNTRANTFK